MKTNRGLFLLLSVLGSTPSFAAELKTYSPPAPAQEVATVKLDWRDPKRDRGVPVKIYHPKDGAGPFPIVIFSHGLGGSRDGYEYLGRHWAGCGYVSVHLQHAGSDSAVWQKLPPAERAGALQKSGASLASALNRPLDVKFAIDELERLNGDKEFPLRGRLDLKHIGVSGHSFGGYTALAIAGQTFVVARNDTQLADPRVTAVIQMSAPVGKIRTDLDRVYPPSRFPSCT